MNGDEHSGLRDTQVPDTQEEFENQSQLNANMASDSGFNWQTNRKRTYDEFQDISLVSARRSQSHHDDLNQQTVGSLTDLRVLQAKINEEHFASVHELRKQLANIQADRQRHADVWGYEQAYDLGNPVTTGAGDALRSSSYTPNRAVDVAAAGTATSNVAISAAVADALTATIPLIVKAVADALNATKAS